MALRDVLLLTNEPTTVQAVTAALSSNGQLSNNNVFRSLPELASRLERGGIPAVLIDGDESADMIARAEPLVRKFGETKFIALSTSMRQELLFEAMHVGVRHVLAKSSIATDLAGVLHRLCPDHAGSQQGNVVSILSAGGGCGATTLAVNLASELPSTNSPNLVVDLDASYGAVGTYLGLDGEYGVYDLLSRAGSIDGQLIQSTSLASSQNIHAMLSKSRRRLGESASLDAARVGDAVEACKAAYGWTVIDAPRVSIDVALELAQRSHVTLIPFQVTIKDIQVARQILSALKDRGVNTDRVLPIASRYRKRGQTISLDEARRALGLADSQTVGTIANDYVAVTEAANLGKPLSQASPRSDYRKDVQKLATMIAAMPKRFHVGRAASLMSGV